MCDAVKEWIKLHGGLRAVYTHPSILVWRDGETTEGWQNTYIANDGSCRTVTAREENAQ